MSTSGIIARRDAQRLVPSDEDRGTRLDNLKVLARKDWDRDPEVVIEEDACLAVLKEELRGEIRHHGVGTDTDLFEDMLNGKRQAFRLRDLIRLTRNARLSKKAGNAVDRVLVRFAAKRGFALIPLGSTNDRRHQPQRRANERRRA